MGRGEVTADQPVFHERDRSVGERAWLDRRHGGQGGVAPRRSTLLLATLAIWAVAWVVWTADVLVEPVPFAIERAARRLPLCLAGVGLCMALGTLLDRVSPRRPALLTGAAAGGIVACSLVFAMLNEAVFYLILPRWGPSSLVHIPDVAMMDGWVFLAWTLLFGALAADAARRGRELALARSEAAALDAQHRLLVSQAQPHFLFNALNAIYALVLDDEVARAAILTLSSYLRRSLDEPDRIVMLAEELALTRDYLAIERLRFGDRLQVREEVPGALLAIGVPGLTVQPLVENSVRHGLAGSSEPVTIMISAERRYGAVRIVVEDDGTGQGSPGGSALGLASIEQRLKAQFGSGARLLAAPRAGGGWRTEIVMPDRP